MKRFHSTILASVGGILAAAGFAWPGFGWLASIGGAAFLIGLSWSLGGLAFPGERPSLRTAFGLLGALAMIAVFGSLTYYAYRLDAWATAGLMLVLPWLVFALSPLAPEKIHRVESDLLPAKRSQPTDGISALLVVLFLLAEAAAVRGFAAAATDEAIRTPWALVHPSVFLWLFVGAASAIALAWRGRYPHFALAAIAIHLFVAFSPSLIVYKLGFGFDPFIHQAAEKVVEAAGVVTPKTPYYIGQYAIVTVLSRLTGAPVGDIDRLLVPALAALFLPLLAAFVARRSFGLDRRLALLTAGAVLFLPLAGFVSTTPQSLADLFTVATAFLGTAWLCRHRPPLAYVLLLAAASASVHPLSGVAALAVAGFLMFFKLKSWQHWSAGPLKAFVFLTFFIATAVALPALFAANARRSGAGASVITAFHRPVPELLSSLPFEAPSLVSRFRPALDFAQLMIAGQPWLLLLISAIGAISIRSATYRRAVWAAGGTFAALLLSVAALRGGLAFSGVIDYEQQNYGNRLFETALLCLAPLVAAGAARLWKSLETADGSMRIFFALLFAAAAVSFAYGAFPRNDDYVFDRGYSVSAHDVAAARSIRERAVGPYIVLSNQATAAAALREYGFLAYYGDQFYYSIPTGAPLYRSYLDMVYAEPSRETMRAAMRRVGVPTAYFVIDEYWQRAPQIVEKAKTTADEWWAVDDGRAFVFRYALN